MCHSPYDMMVIMGLEYTMYYVYMASLIDSHKSHKCIHGNVEEEENVEQ